MLPFLNMYIRSLDSSTLPSASITPGRFTRCEADVGGVTGATRDTWGISLSVLSDFPVWEIPLVLFPFSSHTESKVTFPSNGDESRGDLTVFEPAHSIHAVKSLEPAWVHTETSFTCMTKPKRCWSLVRSMHSALTKVNYALLLSHDTKLWSPQGSKLRVSLEKQFLPPLLVRAFALYCI